MAEKIYKSKPIDIKDSFVWNEMLHNEFVGNLDYTNMLEHEKKFIEQLEKYYVSGKKRLSEKQCAWVRYLRGRYTI